MDGIFVILGRNNIPKGTGTPYDIDRNKLFSIDYEVGEILAVMEPRYQMACCCKPIIAKGMVVICTWYKDSEDNEYPSYYYCWRVKVKEGGKPIDKDGLVVFITEDTARDVSQALT
ncbi:MAG: hypothetical protein J7L11_09760 [Thermoprotei archaeon]|nr:hypothetical protein [Thermoprotei archaeon]